MTRSRIGPSPANRGIERARAAALAMSIPWWATTAGAEPLRILVAASHTKGSSGETALRHSTEDADQVRDVLRDLGGFAPDAIFRVADPTARALAAAIDRARALAATHPSQEVTFVLYFSGHGDRDSIRLGDESMSMADLSARTATVPATIRLLVTDACRNDPTRPKGVVTEPAFALAGAAAPAVGVVWLFASDTGEVAQESDQLKGALFTHYWVSGLRGAADANGDGRVTLAESYDFAYGQTLFRSGSASGVLQHPVATFALTQAAPIVLTETFGTTTKLRFPQIADAHFLVYALGSRTVLNEIWSRADQRVTLAVPPGRYIVQQRSPTGASSAAAVSLALGQDRTLVPADFRSVSEEEVAGKGGQIVLRPDEISLELGAGASRLTDVEIAFSLGYARAFGAWALGVAARGAVGKEHTAANDVTVTSAGLQVTAERRWHLGAPLFAVGGGAAFDIIHQRVERSDAARLASSGYPTSTAFSAAAPGLLATVRMRLPVGEAAWVDSGLRAEVLFPEIDGARAPLWSFVGALGAGVGF